MISISCIQNVLLWTALLGSTSIDSAAPSVQTTTYPLLLADLPLLLLGNEGRTGHQCTTVLAARAGARFAPRHGGSAARAALLASCLLISDPQYPGATIFAHPEVGGDDALIFIHHRPEDLVRVLYRLRRVLDGSDAYEECQWAIERLLNNRREYANPCSCVSSCSSTCPPPKTWVITTPADSRQWRTETNPSSASYVTRGLGTFPGIRSTRNNR